MRTINNKKRIKIDYLQIASSSDLKICHKCGSKGNIVKFEDMPLYEQEMFIPSLMLDHFKEKASFVYCPNCSEYSIVAGIQGWPKN